MPLDVVCEFADRRRETVRRDFIELAEAVAFALMLAKSLNVGQKNGLAEAEFVHVIEDAKTELTVRVFRDA